MSTLIVHLPLSGPATEYDYVLTHDGRTAQAHGRVPVALLPGASAEVVAVVPARALSWHALPAAAAKTLGRLGGNPQRLRAALAGLLEEQLLDEPEQLHFALFLGAQADQGTWVAVCRLDWLRNALQVLEAAQRPVARIVPELAPARDQTSATLCVSAALDPAAVLLTSPRGVTVLPLGAAAITLAHWPADTDLAAEPAVAALAEQAFKRPVTLQTDAERWLQAAGTSWNLAQFELARTKRTRLLKSLARGWQSISRAPQWRAARWSAAALLAVQLLGLNAWAWKEKTLLNGQRAAITQQLLQTFPETTVVVDAPLQMAREVAALAQASGQTSGLGLEQMLLAVGHAMPANQSVQAIEFATGQARLRGLPLDAPQSAELNRQLQAHGWQARPEGEWLIVQTGSTP